VEQSANFYSECQKSQRLRTFSNDCQFFQKYAYTIIFLFNFLWPGSGTPKSSGPWFIKPPEPSVATPLGNGVLPKIVGTRHVS